MENTTNNYYGYLDDGNLPIDNGKCCSHSCSSNTGCSTPEIPDDNEEIFAQLETSNKNINKILNLLFDLTDKIKSCGCNGVEGNHHHHHGEFSLHSNIIETLKNLKLELNNEFAIRSREIFDLKQRLKHLETNVKFLELVKFKKLEEMLNDHLNDDSLKNKESE